MTIEAQLLERVSALLGRRDLTQAELADWAGGSETGGPAGDGLFPLTDSTGFVRQVPSPAKVAAGRPRIDLTNPGVPGTLPLRIDGLDPDGSNTARINANLAVCAAAGLPVRIPAGALIGTRGTIIIPSYLDLRGGQGHEIRSLGKNQLFATVGQAHGVRIAVLRWRGTATSTGSHFTGDFTDSVLSDLDHLGSVNKGLAFVWGRLERTKIYRIRSRNMPAFYGSGGSRWIGGGIDSVIYDADCESYDDAIQMIPAQGTLGIVFENCGYCRARGVSAGARGAILGTNPSTDTIMRNVFMTDLRISGGGWGLRVGAKGHFQYPVAGEVRDGWAIFSYTTGINRAALRHQAGEVVRISSKDTGLAIVGALERRGTTSVATRLIFDVAAKTITAPDMPNAFANIEIGKAIFVTDGWKYYGLNDEYYAVVVGKTGGNVLLLDTAPFADEDNSDYMLSDRVNAAIPAPGLPDGPLPADATIRRNVLPTIDGLRITGEIDDATGTKDTAASFAGYILGYDIDLTVRNPRAKLLGINDGAPTPSGGRIRLRTDQAPVAPAGQPLVDVAFTIGTEITVNGITAPGQDGVYIRSRTEYDDDDPGALYNEALAQAISVGGAIAGLTADAAAVRAVNKVQRIKLRDLTPIAAAGVTTARLAFFGVESSGYVSGCDLTGIAAGNTFENAIGRGLGASVQIGSDNLGLPGYTLPPGTIKAGSLASGSTQIDMGGSIPASLVTRLDLDLDGVSQRAGVDFTTNGTNFVTLSAPVDATSSYSLRHRA